MIGICIPKQYMLFLCVLRFYISACLPDASPGDSALGIKHCRCVTELNNTEATTLVGLIARQGHKMSYCLSCVHWVCCSVQLNTSVIISFWGHVSLELTRAG